MNIITRKAEISDLKLIQDLNYQLFSHDQGFESDLNMDWPYREGESYFRDKINGSHGVCFVAEIENQIVGYLAGGIRLGEDWLKPKRAEIENMFTKEEFRRCGVGKTLITSFIKWSKAQGVQRVVANAFYGNNEGIEFYKKVGFASYDISLELKT